MLRKHRLAALALMTASTNAQAEQCPLGQLAERVYTDLECQFYLGTTAFRAGVFEVAAAHWQRMLTSDSDSADAASLRRTARSTLAYLRYNGMGTPQDRQRAVDDWTTAAGEGAIEARRQLGFAYSDPEYAGRNNVTALAWYQSLVLAFPEPDSLDQTNRAIYDDALAGIRQLESALTELEVSVAREQARELLQ